MITHTKQILAFLASVPLTIGQLSAATPTTSTTIKVTTVAITPAAVTPAGLTPTAVTVSVGLSSSVPVKDDCGWRSPEPGVYEYVPGAFIGISRTTPEDSRVKGNTPGDQMARLSRTSGTATSGVWTARILVASTWTGTWQVSRVFACTGITQLNSLSIDVDPRTIGHTVSLTVSGSHLPNIYLRQSPDAVPWTASTYTRWGRLYDTSSGAGLPDVQLEWCEDVYCGHEGHWDGHPVTTSSLGYFSIPPWPLERLIHGIALLGNPADGFPGFKNPILFVSEPNPTVLPTVTAAPAALAIRAGSTVTVSGRLFGVLACDAYKRHPIQIQYLYGRTAWRSVTTTSSRLRSARWTAAYPARAGRTIYRAYHPAEVFPYEEGACAAATSTPFAVTGV